MDAKEKEKLLEEIKVAVDILKRCQTAWADQVAYGKQRISDYDAINQSIRALSSWYHSVNLID